MEVLDEEVVVVVDGGAIAEDVVVAAEEDVDTKEEVSGTEVVVTGDEALAEELDEEKEAALEVVDVELLTVAAGNSITLLFSPSLTHRFPEESMAIPSFPYKLDCVALKFPATDVALVKLG